MRRSTNSGSASRWRGISRREALALLTFGGVAGAGALARRAHASDSDEAGEAARSEDTVESADKDIDLDAGPPVWARFREVELETDVDGDGQFELLALRGRRLRVNKGEEVLLETDAAWQVSDVLVADFDGDGRIEIAFLLWKRGNYGSARPFWESAARETSTGEEDEPFTQHLFVYRITDDGRVQHVWMSSQLGVQATNVDVVYPDAADGHMRPRLRITSQSGRITLWEWLSWGFALVEEEQDSTRGEASKNEDGALTLLVVGDNIAHTTICHKAYDSQKRTYDFSSLYEHIRAHVSFYDIAAVCQETVLVKNPARTSGYPMFATPQTMGDALVQAGFDVILGATNHINDQGVDAIEDECAYWTREHPEIALVGLHSQPDEAGCPVYLERNGIRLALFDYTYGLNGHNFSSNEAWRVDVLDDGGEDRLIEGITQACASTDTDLVMCFLHIGQEYESTPTSEQKVLAERLIDAGAAAVICSHSHVLGPWGHITTPAGNGGIVFYGLGNFVSGQCDDLVTVVGGAACLRIERTADDTGLGKAYVRIACSELLPLVCHTDAQDGSVAVYPLDDYTDDLAARHVLSSRSDSTLTVADLRNLAAEESSPA